MNKPFNPWAPSGPYTTQYNFMKAKRRNPDISIMTLNGEAVIIPRNGSQERQEGIAALMLQADAMRSVLQQAVNHADGNGSFDVERAKRILKAINSGELGVSK